MVLSRKRPKGVRYYAPFGLSVLVMGLMPRSIGYQDLVALMARQSEVPQRARAHMMTSPFGTIHAATFSFPQPVGTLIPEPPAYQLASVGTYDPETTGALGGDLSGRSAPLGRPRFDFPAVNRRLKGDLLVTLPRDQEPPTDGTRDLTPGKVKTVSFPKPSDPNSADAPPNADAKSVEPPKSQSEPGRYAVASLSPLPEKTTAAPAPLADIEDESNAAVRLGRLYFGNTIGEGVGTIQPWPSDEEVLIEQPPTRDPDLKRMALASPMADDFNFETTSAAPATGEGAAVVGETVAAKGEVTGVGKRPKTPAERLGLDSKQRAKSEKCLADAVYFESRGEVKRGQIAVAQVVMNRVFSGFYPNSVCGVVYQNSHRKFACQFTFTCDGIPDKIDEPDMWEQAKEIARDMLDGKLWLSEIGHSTHYHAYWVHPSWVNEMRKIHKIGVHSFYRPRAWGNTVEVPNYTFVPPHAKM
jgi:spore germination cell wall hydrolase CwlJ-like protein